MLHSPRFWLAALCALTSGLSHHGLAQGTSAANRASAAAEAAQELDSELFYDILVGEINTRLGNAGQGYELILDAARRTESTQLYQRATDIALQSRSGEHALIAARAWQEAFPKSREANRYVLQILVALNRIGETSELLRRELALSSARTKNATLAALPQIFNRASNKALATKVVEEALSDVLEEPASAASAWVAIGRMRLAAGLTSEALAALQKALERDSLNEYVGRLALDLLDDNVPGAEPLMIQLLEQQRSPELRLAYTRSLLAKQRFKDATEQLQRITRDHPDLAEPWLILASLQLQESQTSAAEQSIERYLRLANEGGTSELRQRGLNQAYLINAQIAESRQDFAGAERWLSRLDDSSDLFNAQVRRASLMARQGKVSQARAFLRELPSRSADEQRMKLQAEVQLLRDLKMYSEAFLVQTELVGLSGEDNEAVYEQAMLAEKAGKLDEMESLLRQLIARNPQFHHAYNALGYSLADRGLKLEEARQLIIKALEFAPEDPFITDSLGWVEYRMGRLEEAYRLLNKAYTMRPDAEIAAHLGEVLWAMDKQSQALTVWQEGLKLNPDNEAINATLKRFGVKP